MSVNRARSTSLSVETQNVRSVSGQSAVRYIPDSQSLADTAQVPTFMFSERVGRMLAKRSVDDGVRRLDKLEAMLEEHFQKIPDLERQQKLNQLLAQVECGQVENLAQLEGCLKGFSSEICHQFVALSYLRRELSRKNDSRALLALIDRTLLKMAYDCGREIELGIRIGLMAGEAEAQGLAGIQPLRDTYRDAVMDCQGLASLWEHISKRFSHSALEGVVKFMMKALSADLDSQGGLGDVVKLQMVMRDMSQLRALLGIYEQVNSLWHVVVEGGPAHGIRAN